MNLTVCVMHPDLTFERLYEYIPTWEEADLIAQYAMNTRVSMNDLIFVFPGWNRGIDKNPVLWTKAAILAQKYAAER